MCVLYEFESVSVCTSKIRTWNNFYSRQKILLMLAAIEHITLLTHTLFLSLYTTGILSFYFIPCALCVGNIAVCIWMIANWYWSINTALFSHYTFWVSECGYAACFATHIFSVCVPCETTYVLWGLNVYLYIFCCSTVLLHGFHHIEIHECREEKKKTKSMCSCCASDTIITIIMMMISIMWKLNEWGYSYVAEYLNGSLNKCLCLCLRLCACVCMLCVCISKNIYCMGHAVLRHREDDE